MLASVAFVLLPIVAILVPILWIKRLVVNLEVVDRGGNPLSDVSIRGVRNEAGAGRSATGEGRLVGKQLEAATKVLGRTDARGRFRATYFVSSYHTLWIGEREVYVDDLRKRMSATSAARIEMGNARGRSVDV